jgi:hypothetical protein
MTRRATARKASVAAVRLACCFAWLMAALLGARAENHYERGAVFRVQLPVGG